MFTALQWPIVGLCMNPATVLEFVHSVCGCGMLHRSSSVRLHWQAAEIFLQRWILWLVAPGDRRHVGVVSYEEEIKWFADAVESRDTDRWTDYTV